MIPIRDTIPSKKNYPVVNNIIIAIDTVLFIAIIFHGRSSDMYMFTYCLVPTRYFNDTYSAYFSFGQRVASFFTFMFLHGSFWHLIGNMWSLYIFGDKEKNTSFSGYSF